MLWVDVGRAVETVKQLRQSLRRDADARIDDRHQRAAITIFDSHDDSATLGAILNRILNQVLDRLLQAQLISADERGLTWAAILDRMLREQRPHLLDQASGQPAQVERRRLDTQLPELESRYIQQRRDHLAQARGLLGDHTQRLLIAC